MVTREDRTLHSFDKTINYRRIVSWKKYSLTGRHGKEIEMMPYEGFIKKDGICLRLHVGIRFPDSVYTRLSEVGITLDK